MRIRKVLLLIPSMSSAGGAEKLVDSLSRLLSTEYEVSIASFDPPGTTRHFESNVPFFAIGGDSDLPLPLRVFTYLRAARRLKALKSMLGTELTISVLWRADLINMLTASRNRILSLAVINILDNKINEKMVRMRAFVSWVYQRFDKILAINPAIANELQVLCHLDKNKVGVFKNFLAKPDPQPFFSDSDPRFVFCGRSVYEKNIDGLLHVWARYIRRNPGRQLVIIGDGPLFVEMQSLTTKLGLSIGVTPSESKAQVLFVGSSKQPEAFMMGARAFLLTSRHEGVPTVAILAASLGLPVLGADCHGGGMRHLFGISADVPLSLANDFHSQTGGLLLPVPDNTVPDTIDAWVHSMEMVDLDQVMRESLVTGAHKMAANHSPETVRKDWSATIEQIFSQ